jgi:putative phosphoesterase
VKIAILADVHGNLAALEAALADLEQVRPDLVVHGGDLALNGPRPAECVAAIRERGWPGVLGNTDQALEDLVTEPAAAWTRERLGEEPLAWLQTLPLEWRHEAGIALVHAVPGDLWTAVRADTTDAELRAIYGPLGSSIAVYCHIHTPYIREIGDLTVANTGSVGMPFDGDPRASYLLISNGRCETRRVGYDIERAVHEIEHSGHPAAAQIAKMYRTARSTRA